MSCASPVQHNLQASDPQPACGLVDEGLAARAARLERGAGVDGMLHEHRVEVTAQQRHAPHARTVLSPDAHAAAPGHDHAANREACTFESPAIPAAAGIERSGIERVAAQLVARERGAVQQAHAQPARASSSAAIEPAGPAPAIRTSSLTSVPGARRPRRVRRRAAHACPSTSALFFEPKPRQLQSAALGSAARPASG